MAFAQPSLQSLCNVVLIESGGSWRLREFHIRAGVKKQFLISALGHVLYWT